MDGILGTKSGTNEWDKCGIFGIGGSQVLGGGSTVSIGVMTGLFWMLDKGGVGLMVGGAMVPFNMVDSSNLTLRERMTFLSLGSQILKPLVVSS